MEGIPVYTSIHDIPGLNPISGKLPQLESSDVLITFDNEDHTLGSLLRAKILLNPDIVFAGYRIPHPLKKIIELRVKTISSDVISNVKQSADSIVLDIKEFEKKLFTVLKG